MTTSSSAPLSVPVGSTIEADLRRRRRIWRAIHSFTSARRALKEWKRARPITHVDLEFRLTEARRSLAHWSIVTPVTLHEPK
jgi:hypothetical protein